jgi:lysophospholipase L1-like esterase
MKIRIRSLMYCVGFIALFACSQQTSTPTVAGTYTAIGASDAVGLGASVPCGTATSTTSACVGGTGYVPKIATLLSNTGNPIVLTDLGISGAVIGPDIASVGNLYGDTSTNQCMARSGDDAITADFLSNEVPKLPANAAYVTIFAGTNDAIALANALGCGAGGSTLTTQQAFITAQTTAFATDYARLIAAVKSSSPNAHIVVANIPNLAAIPFGAQQSATARQALQALSVAFDTVINNLTTQGIPVADVLCSSQSYLASNFSTDGLHPNDSGYAFLASLMEPLLLSNTPASLSTSCSQAALAGTTQQQSMSAFTVRIPSH